MPRSIKHPRYRYIETAQTLDDLIERLEELRREHGGDVVVACMKDSSDTAHLLEGFPVADYVEAEDAWDPEDRHRGPAIMVSIND